jgi:uncharacterized membrane protein
VLQRTLLVLLLALAAHAGAEPPSVLACRGHEPEWSLRIDGGKAILATLGTTGLVQTAFEGRLQETAGQPPSFVYRGRSSGNDLVAVITREACVDTMADAAEGGGRFDHAARVSLPDGATRLGCCSVASTAATRPESPAKEPPPAAPVAPSGIRGEITALALPDGTECRQTEAGSTLRFRGQRVRFDCGRSAGDTVTLVGPLTPGPEGMLQAQKAFVPWRSGEQEPRHTEATAVRPSEIVLTDGLICRFAGVGATLAFEGRRLSYTCGTKDGDTVALLGDLEPVEGGFRILLAKIAHGESGFTVRSSEPILVDAPR